jgi:hypothetical protein
MKFLTSLLFLLLFSRPFMGYSQDLDSLLLPENEPAEKNYVTGAFKSTRVIMSHSMEMLKKGVLDFRILHRFGPVNGGARELFGLDGPASVRLGLDYAISDRFTLGIGRSTHKKELDGFVKFRPIQQGTGNSSAPLSLVLAAGSTINTAKWIYPERKDVLVNRMGYYLFKKRHLPRYRQWNHDHSWCYKNNEN